MDKRETKRPLNCQQLLRNFTSFKFITSFCCSAWQEPPVKSTFCSEIHFTTEAHHRAINRHALSVIKKTQYLPHLLKRWPPKTWRLWLRENSTDSLFKNKWFQMGPLPSKQEGAGCFLIKLISFIISSIQAHYVTINSSWFVPIAGEKRYKPNVRTKVQVY